MWYHDVIGRGECPIIDTWWQTETGAHMIAPFPVTALKPGSCTQPLPGIDAAILDEEGNELGRGEGGLLVIKKPWPSMIRTVWNDDDRYKSTYFPLAHQPNYYVVGDSAYQDKDGYFWILGRIDDVLNVSGHRLGTMEIESALVSHPQVAEAAVVGRPHDVKGEAVAAFVVLNIDLPKGDARSALIAELREHVSKEIGPIAKPDDIRFGTNLPKTRSGKIMRRLLRSIAKGEEITQDTSTLEDSTILDQFQQK
jgi:acetyl-CoA synthetase